MAEPSILQKKAEIFLEKDVYPLLKSFPQAEKFSLSQEIKQSCFKLIRASVMVNNLKIFYMRQGVNAYGYKIKATHLELRTESKRKEKRKVKAMIAKLREGKKTRKEIQQEVNSWLGFARWASAYNLAKKIFAPYRFIKPEGELPYGAISRSRQARRVLQQRLNSQKAHKTLAA